MSVVHISPIFNVTSMRGVVRKLKQQSKAFDENGCRQVIIVPQGTPREMTGGLVHEVHTFKINILNKVLKFFKIFKIIKENNADRVIIRYTRIDPSVLMLLFVNKRTKIYFEFHSCLKSEILNSQKYLMSLLLFNIEKFIFLLIRSRITGSISTSKSIKENNIKNFHLEQKQNLVLLNYLNTDEYLGFENKRNFAQCNTLRFVMAASKFQYWHGFEEAVKIANRISRLVDYNVEINVVGDSSLINFTELSIEPNLSIIEHGILEWKEVINVLLTCDIGIDSLGLDKLNLKDISTLKAKEYLATDLIVLTDKLDSVLNEFPERLLLKRDLDRLTDIDFKTSILSKLSCRKKLNVAQMSQLDWRPAITNLVKQISI